MPLRATGHSLGNKEFLMTAPFRADHVGSFLRPPSVKAAWEARDRGELTPAQAAEVEDREITRIIARQEQAGLKLATDGECRRAVWSMDFFQGLRGLEKATADRGVMFHGMEATRKSVRLVGKLGFAADHPMIGHFRFLKDHTRVTAKMTIPSPPVAHFRLTRAQIDPVYPDIEEFFHDLGQTYRDAVHAFYDAGCRYLQFDDTVWAYLCDPEQLALAKERGHDPDRLPEAYARMVSHALSGRPRDMAITTHVCRGNFRSTWISEGGYEPVAETLLGKVNYDGYFLEYDTDRAGGFEPLRFLPRGDKQVVLGLITSKSGTLEHKDDIKRRIDEAARFADPEQFCLSPQCGFASTEEGNILTEEQQWAKLREIVELADEVWGR